VPGNNQNNLRKERGRESMTKGYKTKYKGSLPDRDIDVLWMIYQLQAVLTRDLISAYYTSEQTGKQRLIKLNDKEYITKRRTVNKDGQADGSVCSIADKAIDELIRVGKTGKNRRARDMQLPTKEMLLRIEVSKVAISLDKAGWEILGSREAKIRLGLQPNTPLQFLFTSPEEQAYQVYVLDENADNQTLVNITTELRESKRRHMIIYKTKGPEEISIVHDNLAKLIVDQRIYPAELCLIPLTEYEDKLEKGKIRNMAIELLTTSSHKQLENYLRKQYGKVKYSDNLYGFGDMVVEQEGKDYHVCNYLRRDRTSLWLLAQHLTESAYQRTGKGAIVVTWQGYVNEVREIINSVQKRAFIKVKWVRVQDIVDSQ